MGIKRPKKGSESHLKSTDKKARYEAGLDLAPGNSYHVLGPREIKITLLTLP